MPDLRFHEDDRVRFKFGIRSLQGVIKEDHAPIGIRGRRLYLVQFHPEAQSATSSLIELPEDQLELIELSMPA